MLDKCQKHLDTVHESYFQHLKFAACFGIKLVFAGMAAILHGLCPAVFQKTGSSTVFALHDELKARAAQNQHHHHD